MISIKKWFWLSASFLLMILLVSFDQSLRIKIQDSRAQYDIDWEKCLDENLNMYSLCEHQMKSQWRKISGLSLIQNFNVLAMVGNIIQCGLMMMQDDWFK